MARAFRRKGARFVARLDSDERAIVASLMEQTRTLLAPDVPSTGDAVADLLASIEAQIDPPEGMPRGTATARAGTERGDRDPALARLLPDAHRGDPAVAAEFRRLTEQDLRRRKTDNLTAAIDALRAQPEGPADLVSLDRQQAQALVVALTDTRLLLGERLGLRTESDVLALEERVQGDPAHPLAYPVAVYDFLTWLQETLAGALSGRRSLGLG